MPSDVNYCGYCKNYIFEMCFKFKKQVNINNIGCEHYSPCVERQIEILKEQKRG